MIDVRDFGAIPGTDATLAFQAAINSAPYGCPVYIPWGRYPLRDIIIRRPISIVGDKGGTVLVQTNPNLTPLTVQTRGEVNIHGLTFWGCDNRKVRLNPANPTSGDGKLLLCAGESVDAPLRGLRVQDCSFHDTVTVGLMLQHVYGGKVSGCRWTKDSLGEGEDHTLSGPRVGIFSGAAPCRDIIIEGNEWTGNSHYGPEFSWDEGFVFMTNTDNLIIRGNTVRDFRLEAIHITGSALITGNTLSTRTAGLSCAGILAWQDIDGDGRDFIITGNRITGSGLGLGIAMKTEAPQFGYSAIIDDNVIRDFVIGIGATNGDLDIHNNLITHVKQGFNTTLGEGSKNCPAIQLSGNRITAEEFGLFFNAGVTDGVVATNNRIKSPTHYWFLPPEGEPITKASISGDRCMDLMGRMVQPVYLWDKRPAFITEKS